MRCSGEENTHLRLRGRPVIESGRADERDVHAQVAMNARAANADEHAQRRGCPARRWKTCTYDIDSVIHAGRTSSAKRAEGCIANGQLQPAPAVAPAAATTTPHRMVDANYVPVPTFCSTFSAQPVLWQLQQVQDGGLVPLNFLCTFFSHCRVDAQWRLTGQHHVHTHTRTNFRLERERAMCGQRKARQTHFEAKFVFYTSKTTPKQQRIQSTVPRSRPRRVERPAHKPQCTHTHSTIPGYCIPGLAQATHSGRGTTRPDLHS